MKARPFLAVLLAVVVAVLGLGLGGWWLVWQRSPLQLARRPLDAPRAARFVPRQAPLALYLFTDGEEPVAYARAVADGRRRREAADAVARLRDGAFAAAGLDYPNELAGWLDAPVGLALFDAPSPGVQDPEASSGAGGWLLVLGSRDEDGARRFLQRFWQTRSLAGTDLQVSRYRGMGLISGRGALVGQKPMPLATALVDDDLVLIASGRGILEQALDVSQIDELNQAGQPGFAGSLEQLGPAAALLLARPQAIEHWLGLALPDDPADRPTRLIAALRPEGRGLALRGRLDLSTPLPPASTLPVGRREALLAGRRGDAASLALLHDPAGLVQVPLLAPLLSRSLAPVAAAAAGPLPALVAGADRGALLAADGGDGWLLGTAGDQPDPAALEAPLAAEGLIPAPVELADHSLLVWTRLAATTRGSRRGVDDSLQASLAGWRTVENGLAWWGGRLELLDARTGAEGGRRTRQLEELDRPSAPFQWALAPAPARALLHDLSPWRLLGVLAGGSFEDPVQGLALAIEPEGAGLRLDGRIDFD
ncbi:DUF3352 domain-containing protein [Cyanobium sp. FGCU-6]|jgi:hypothetical protein|nr:DUF3352 domain-containing protein [Cyanobium sp. FGCU6]